MPNKSSTARAICPFYVRDGAQTITCDGMCEGGVNRISFSGVEDKRRWMLEKCERWEYRACPWARTLERMYGATREERW